MRSVSQKLKTSLWQTYFACPLISLLIRNMWKIWRACMHWRYGKNYFCVPKVEKECYSYMVAYSNTLEKNTNFNCYNFCKCEWSANFLYVNIMSCNLLTVCSKIVKLSLPKLCLHQGKLQDNYTLLGLCTNTYVIKEKI